MDARRLWVKYLGRDLQPVVAAASEMESAAASIRRIITERFADVGDFSEHPVNEKMQKLVVRSDEIEWTIPAHPGVRTQYHIGSVADRREVAQMLVDYIKRGYLKEVSAEERIYMSPLLPRPKPNGTFRLTNDY